MNHNDRPRAKAPKGAGPGNRMMIACSIPMLIVAVTLVATGIVSFGFLLLLSVCGAMMVMMMRAMTRSGT